MKCLCFGIETPYLANFRNPFSTITILSYAFPPYTTIRGLLANALGLERDDYSLQDIYEISLKPLNMPERTQDIVLMKKLKSNLSQKERKLLKMVDESNGSISTLNEEELKTLNGLKYIRSTSAPFVKEFVTQIKCMIYVLGAIKDLTNLKCALENPARPLYIGGSDDFVIVENIEIVDAVRDKSSSIDSILRINSNIQPIDKKRVVGRIPYKFKAINLKKKEYIREDAIVAAPIPRSKLLLNYPIECFNIEGDSIAF